MYLKRKYLHYPAVSNTRIILFLCFCGILSGASCNSGSKITVIGHEGPMGPIAWSNLDREKIVKTIHKTIEASHHLLRLQTSENPHIHDHHDLTAIMIQGMGRIHFADHSQEMKPGDMVYIPRGTYHWAENLDPEASEMYVIFTPAFDGKDRRFINPTK